MLADFIVAIHLAYVSYVVLGQLAILVGWPLHWRWIRNPWFRTTHLIMIVVVAVEAMVEFECPLTTWELSLRAAAGTDLRVDPSGEEDVSFVGRLLRSIMFFDNEWQPVVNAGYYIFAGIVLATAFLIPPRFRKRAVAGEPTPPADAPTLATASETTSVLEGPP